MLGGGYSPHDANAYGQGVGENSSRLGESWQGVGGGGASTEATPVWGDECLVQYLVSDAETGAFLGTW